LFVNQQVSLSVCLLVIEPKRQQTDQNSVCLFVNYWVKSVCASRSQFLC